MKTTQRFAREQRDVIRRGQFGEEQFNLRQSVETDGPPGSTGKMKATVRIDSRRVGECDAKSAQG